MCMVGGTMHWHDALTGEDIVQDREDALLVLAGIGTVANQNHLLLEAHGDDGFRAAAMALRIRLEARAVDYGKSWHERGELALLGPAQHVANKERMPGKFIDHPDIQ